jgi:N utilization substance protein A
VQRIREAERGVLFERIIDMEKEILTGVVQRVEKNGRLHGLDRAKHLWPPNVMISNEKYNVNDKIKVYVLEVQNSNKGPQILVSRDGIPIL